MSTKVEGAHKTLWEQWLSNLEIIFIQKSFLILLLFVCTVVAEISTTNAYQSASCIFKGYMIIQMCIFKYASY
jgi:hypothetical protein